MKATIEIPDGLYQQVKVKSTLEGVTVREVTITLFQHWVEEPPAGLGASEERSQKGDKPLPAWFGALRKYAVNAKGRHDMESIRHSVARGRAAKDKK